MGSAAIDGDFRISRFQDISKSAAYIDILAGYYNHMASEEKNVVKKKSHIDDIDAWLDEKLVEDREILDALGRK